MINLERYFSVIFDSGDKVSNLNLKRFTEKHLAALVHNNTGGKYDTLIALTSTAFNNFFGNVEDKHLAISLQKSRTLVNDNALEQFETAVDKHYNLIIYKFPEDTPEYLEFFPRGKTEYNKITKGNAPLLMENMIDACTAHVAEITQAIVDEFTAIRDLYDNSRTEQLQQMEESDLESTEISETRSVLEFQINKNLLILATEYLGNVQAGMDFFDQQYLGITGNGGDDGPTPPVSEVITAVTDQSTPGAINIDMSGTGGEEVIISWGDTNTTPVTLQGSPASFPHTYTAPDSYNINITDSVEAIEVIRLTNTKLIDLSFPDTMNPNSIEMSDNHVVVLVIHNTFTNLLYLFASNNDLDQQSVNNSLININNFGTSNGQIFLDGGTNAAPTGQGLAAKNQLISRGWTVNTN